MDELLKSASNRLIRQLSAGTSCSLEPDERSELQLAIEYLLVDPRLLKEYVHHLSTRLGGECPEYDWLSEEQYEAIVHEGLEPLTDAQFVGLMVDPEGLVVVAQHLVERCDLSEQWFASLKCEESDHLALGMASGKDDPWTGGQHLRKQGGPCDCPLQSMPMGMASSIPRIFVR